MFEDRYQEAVGDKASNVTSPSHEDMNMMKYMRCYTQVCIYVCGLVMGFYFMSIVRVLLLSHRSFSCSRYPT